MTWRSPIYSFFKSNVNIQYHEGRLVHFFACAARACKSPIGGIRRFQDKQDKSSTANLRSHAIRCFGREAVDTAMNAKDAEAKSGSIFAVFARQRQRPAHHSHRPLTNMEIRCIFRVYSFTSTQFFLPVAVLSNGSSRATAR